jgi:Putative amidase domain
MTTQQSRGEKMSAGSEQDLQSAKRQQANAAAQHRVEAPVTTPYAAKEAVADSGPVAVVQAVKDSVVAHLSLCQQACAMSPGREYGQDDVAGMMRQLGPVFTESTGSVHTTELQRAVQLAASDPSYERYEEAVFVVTAWQGVTIADTVANVLLLGHYTYRISGEWGDDPTYQFQIVMRLEDGWRIEQLEAVSTFDDVSPDGSAVVTATVDQTASAIQPASLTSFDRQKAATAAIHYGACTTLACYWVLRNVGGDPNTDYPNFANRFSDDCTNFVSEMLAIGGLAQTSSDLAATDPAAWYSELRPIGVRGGGENIERAHNWTVVQLFWEYMSGQHNPHGRNLTYFTKNDPSSNINDADLADVVIYDWGTTSQPNYDHLTLETGFGAELNYGYSLSTGFDPGFYGDLISQHSPGRSNHPWNWGWTSQHNALYRARMRDRGWYVMHWGEHGTNGYPFLAG